MKNNRNIKKRRILIITAYTKPINMGGGSNAEAFAGFLNEKGYSAKVLAKTNIGLIRRKNNKILVRWPNARVLKIISLFWIFPYSLFLCARNNYVFFISNHFPLMPLLLLFSKAIGRRTVFRSSLIGDDDPYYLKTKFSIYSRLCLHSIQNADVYHSINPAFTDSYYKVFNNVEKVVEVTQGVNTSRFTSGLKKMKEIYCGEFGINPKAPIILSVGFLIDRKGYKEVFEMLSSININFTYIVVGDYSVSKEHPLYYLNNEMQRNYAIGNNLLKNRIRFLGSIDNIEKIYAISDIILMNSCAEGTPNALLEAMATGVVPVVRELKGVSNYLIIDKLSGLVYNDIVNAKKSIIELFHSKEELERMSIEAVSFSERVFSFDKIWDEINSVFQTNRQNISLVH